MGVTNPSLFLSFIQQDQISMVESTSLKETFFLTIFGIKSMTEVRSESKLASKPAFCTHCLTYSSIRAICITLRHDERVKH